MAWYDTLAGFLPELGEAAQAVEQAVGFPFSGIGIGTDLYNLASGGSSLLGALGGQWDQGPPTPPGLGGATGSWEQGGAMQLMRIPMNGMGRGLIPFSGQYIPGYRVALRPASRGSAGHAAGYYLVKPRRMNPLNPRALMRAERRMGAFTHWVKRHFTIQKSMPRRKKVGGRKRR